MKKRRKTNVILPQNIEQKIYHIRGKKVMLDSDLAKLYKVKTKDLNAAIKRNVIRFPKDFMFRLNQSEFQYLRLKISTSSSTWGGRRFLPLVFTEQGVAMLSSVLHSETAISVNIEIMRTFAKLRELILTHNELQKKIEEMEKKYDKKFNMVFQALRELLSSPKQSKSKSKKIGF